MIFQEPLETNVIGFGMPQTLNMCDSSHFDTFFPVKINKMWNFWLLLPWNSIPKPWCTKKFFPVKINKKKSLTKNQFEQEKSVWKGLNICTYRFVGMPIAMHYVRTLCDKYFLSYFGFSWFVTGRSKYRVLKHVVGVEWDQRRTAA